MENDNDLKKNLENVYVVMVEPKNPGNIGSAVRAMKNMGVMNLRLVNPPEGYKEAPEQRMLGYRSQEITEKSKVYPTLFDAVKDMTVVFLATRKGGKWKKDFMLPEQAGEIVVQRGHKEKIAIVFGREDSGVTVDESQVANYFIHVPMANYYPSLNLSQAILVVLYEVFKKVGTMPALSYPKKAPSREYDRLHNNLWKLMKSLLLREEDKGLFDRSMKRALNRAHWTNADIAVFDRIAKQVRWFIKSKSKEEFIDDSEYAEDYDLERNVKE